MIGYYINHIDKEKITVMRVGDYIDDYYSRYFFTRVTEETYKKCEYEEIEEVG